MSKLNIAEGFSLPLDFVTKTIAILAQRRKGKTYTASVLAEELIAAKVPVVVLDPTGAWWGLRASADGKSAGLPVVILGGQHGDLPLERSAGVFVADLAVDHPGHYVIDFSLFESAEAEREFATAFAQRLYRRKAHAGMNFPMHLIIDEADRFIPQRVPSGDQTMLGAFETIVRRGGLRGLGTTVISQRAAVVNKNVLEQIDTLIVLRNVGPNDQAAILDYVKAKGTPEEMKEIRESMASLELGEAWVWEPGSEPYLFKRIKIRARHTFNSSATPEAGKVRVEPKHLAAIDIEAIKSKMSETIKRAKENDPRELKRQIADLKRQLANAPTETVTKEVMVADQAAIRTAVESDRRLMRGAFVAHLHKVNDEITRVRGEFSAITEIPFTEPGIQFEQIAAPRVPPPHPRPVPARLGSVVTNVTKVTNVTSPANGLGRTPQLMMNVLVSWHPRGVTRGQLAAFVGIKADTGSFRQYLSTLRTSGKIKENGVLIMATDEAVRELAGSVPPPPQTTREVVDLWKPKLGKTPAQMLEVVVSARGDEISREELAGAVGCAADTGSFRQYLSTLSTAGLIVKSGQMVAANKETLFL